MSFLSTAANRSVLSAFVIGGSLTAAQAAGLTDQIDCGSPVSERAHAVAFGGIVVRGTVGDAVGGQETAHPARTVRGSKSWLSYRVAVSSGEPTTLEFEEIYGRDTEVRGYQILVNDRPLYLRTFQGSGAGPVHYFVQIPATGKKQITVRLVNQSETPFSIRRLWAFAGFTRYFQQNRLDVPYRIAPVVALSFTDFEADQKRLRQIRDSVGTGTTFQPGFTAFVPYAQMDAREVEERIDYLLRLAEVMKMPVQMGFDTWWGSTPSGSDGRGGYWTDVRYQQVVYNATTRGYQLSVPNRWSNTPWLSPSQEDLNRFKERRLRESLTYLRQRRQALRAAGAADQVLAVNLDNEPVYWASGNAGLGSDLLQADFSQSAVNQAKRADVTLDPTDGLSRPENLWLFRNLLAYNERIGRAAVAGLGQDAVRVAGSTVTPPGDSLSANVYTQAMIAGGMPQYPMLDSGYPFWETAAPAGIRMGGEWNGDTIAEQQALLHQIALGRAAAVNAEGSQNVEKRRGVRVGYALGQRYYTPYNYPLDKMDVATADLRDLRKPFPPFVFQPVLQESRFTDDAWKTQASRLGSLQTGLIGGTAAVAAFPESSDRPGFLEYRLAPKAGAFTNGLFLELTGRAFVSQRKDPTVHVRVMAGAGPDTLREVARFHDTGSFGAGERIDLSSIAGGQNSVLVRIEMNAPGLSPDVLSWCSVRGVRFTTGWEASLTSDLPPQDESLETVRRQNLLVSARRDAEIALAALERRIGAAPLSPGAATGKFSPRSLLAQARTAQAEGRYGDAYRAATGAASVLLPAAYSIGKSGVLQPYPLEIDAGSPVIATLLEYSASGLRLEMQTERPTAIPVRLHLFHLSPGTRYRVTRSGASVVLRRIVATDQNAAGSVLVRVDDRGELVVPTEAAPLPRTAEPTLWQGVFQSASGDAFSFTPTDGSNRKRLTTDSRTVIRRGEGRADQQPVALSHLRAGDRIEARIGADGVVLALSANGDRREGTVQVYTPLSPFAQPSLTLREDGLPRAVHLYATLHLPSGDTTARAMPVGAPFLQPGDRVIIQADPVTGRIHELWRQESTSP